MIPHLEDPLRRGWPLFVLAPGTKIPPKGHTGRKEATLSEDQIAEWLREYPSCNFGIDTDSAGLVVIDLDVPKEDQDPTELFGLDAWGALLHQYGINSEPRTYTVQTPSGGLHYYFTANPVLRIKNSNSVVAPGVDTKGINGQIVAAGSKTPKGEYRVVRHVDPIPMPHWLRRLLSERGVAQTRLDQLALERKEVTATDAYALGALRNEINNVISATQKNRNDTLNKAAFALRRFIPDFLDEEETREELLKAALSIGLPESEALSTIKSGFEARRE